MTYIQKPPVSKRELLNRLLSHDFDGDLRGLGARVSRVNASTIELRFDEIDRTFQLSVRIPREEKSGKKLAMDDFAAPLPSTRKASSKH